MNTPQAPANPPSLPGPEDHRERLQWRICFWLIFLLTPVVTAVFGASGAWLRRTLPDPIVRAVGSEVIHSFGTMTTPFIGALAAGFCLTKLHARPKTTLGLFACTIALGVAVLIVYLAIAFAGCIVAFSKHPI